MEKAQLQIFFIRYLTLNNIPVATIGTLGIKTNKIKKNNLTSPDVISLHKELEILKDKKINNVLLEASSHGLSQGRINGINIKSWNFYKFYSRSYGLSQINEKLFKL